MRKLRAIWRLRLIKADAQRYYEATAYHLAKASRINHDLSYEVHKVGIFGGPRIEPIRRPEDVRLYEKGDYVVIKDGCIYRLTKEAV